MICKKEESADSDIVLSAALLRDLIVYPKRSSKTLNSADDSAEIAQKILSQYHSYPTEKIEKKYFEYYKSSYN
jgi:HD superfamily phosphodiesterase